MGTLLGVHPIVPWFMPPKVRDATVLHGPMHLWRRRSRVCRLQRTWECQDLEVATRAWSETKNEGLNAHLKNMRPSKWVGSSSPIFGLNNPKIWSSCRHRCKTYSPNQDLDLASGVPTKPQVHGWSRRSLKNPYHPLVHGWYIQLTFGWNLW